MLAPQTWIYQIHRGIPNKRCGLASRHTKSIQKIGSEED
jgi:hypothetical protein